MDTGPIQEGVRLVGARVGKRRQRDAIPRRAARRPGGQARAAVTPGRLRGSDRHRHRRRAGTPWFRGSIGLCPRTARSHPPASVRSRSEAGARTRLRASPSAPLMTPSASSTGPRPNRVPTTSKMTTWGRLTPPPPPERCFRSTRPRVPRTNDPGTSHSRSAGSLGRCSGSRWSRADARRGGRRHRTAPRAASHR